MRGAVARTVLKAVGPRATTPAGRGGDARGIARAGADAGRREPLPLRQPRGGTVPRPVLQQLTNLALSDLLPGDHPLFALIDQVRQNGTTISDHDLSLESPRLRKQDITVQATALAEEPGAVLLCLQDSSAARALDRQTVFRSAPAPSAGWRRCWRTR